MATLARRLFPIPAEAGPQIVRRIFKEDTKISFFILHCASLESYRDALLLDFSTSHEFTSQCLFKFSYARFPQLPSVLPVLHSKDILSLFTKTYPCHLLLHIMSITKLLENEFFPMDCVLLLPFLFVVSTSSDPTLTRIESPRKIWT